MNVLLLALGAMPLVVILGLAMADRILAKRQLRRQLEGKLHQGPLRERHDVTDPDPD